MVTTYAVVSLLLVFAVSLLIIRIGTIALTMTGLSHEIASFQSVSAFSGAGFTTREAEGAISTPERRKIVKTLIRLGSLGIVTAVATLVLSFAGEGPGSNFRRFLYILFGTAGIILLARSRWLNRLVTPAIEWGLGRTTDLDLRDYTQLLRLQSGYRVAEIDVKENDWLANKTLRELRLSDEGILALGIIRADGSYLGAPGGNESLRVGDTLLAYGREHRLQELSERREDDRRAHEAAVKAHVRETDDTDLPSYT
ncbi:TrkA C-terminal domain-containing protein [Haloarcula sp. JP-L23]|uniref:TrkA C-terminal domain-containing protein n=1 Tax=Haloarcula sp. JP-L23 TaxID=2716717 RepID=UPI00140EA2F0|nr:TrkA-C domain protein [Haloarcula sp. JP-L23]